MSAIKTPVRVERRRSYSVILDAEGRQLLSAKEDVLDELAAAINATFGAGLTVEALEQRVVERAIAYMRRVKPLGIMTIEDAHELRGERETNLALIPAAPNSEAGHD